MSKLQPIRGTHDLLPDAQRLYRALVTRALQVAETYGFAEMSPPIFEATEVFQRTLGDTSDVVSKETYSFTDRGGESITLRPEFTAGIARAFISGGLQEQLPLKFFYHGPAFRYERPQKGRQRQFHQLGVEWLGVKEPVADVETMALAYDMLCALGLKPHITLEINSLGDAESRARYRAALVEYFTQHRAQLSADSQARLERNPLRILDSKDEGDKRINANAPAMEAFFTDASRAFFAAVQDGLRALGIPFTHNPRLVRGLDYYNHTVFEFIAEGLGAQNTVLAGGRYDGLISTMGGPETPGVGFAAGIERLALVVEAHQPHFAPSAPRPVVVLPLSEAQASHTLQLAHRLRQAGVVVEHLQPGNVGKRMKRADKLRARFVILLGEDEAKTGHATLRDLDSGEQNLVLQAELLPRLLALTARTA